MSNLWVKNNKTKINSKVIFQKNNAIKEGGEQNMNRHGPNSVKLREENAFHGK